MGREGVSEDYGWYGVDRFLDSTWDLYGGKPTDPAEQARIGRRYIRERYGDGDWLMPGVAWFVNNTGKPIRVLAEQQERDRKP